MDISDYSFYRYLGKGQLISNGVHMEPREVVGLIQANDSLFYIAHPKYPGAVAISGDSGEMIIANSRKFTAAPNALFSANFNFTPSEVAEQAPEAVQKPKPKPVVLTKKPEPSAPAPEPVSDTSYEEDDAATARAKRIRADDMPDFGNLKPLVYAPAIYSGGSANNYAVKPVPKCGKVHLEVFGLDDLQVPRAKLEKYGVSPPDYVLKDIQENVMPGIGLNFPLPFKRLYVGLSKENSDIGSHIVTYPVHGFMYGAITIDPKQLIKYFGGFNSLSVAHVITHELAHFVDHTMLRNVERMRFEQAIRGKKIHPDSLTRQVRSVPTEHFATLAELMVWGASLRNVYTLNGFDVVAKYFENRYVPQKDIESRKV
ncbi:hypothetical protein HOS33_gp142 [Erwinia phage vB_EamM_Y3]|uniref:KTSC and Metallopeptidase-like N-terminal fusion domain-containing protein n=1 Tax=Erwinia phage vB_EamM_Y3 TaxID=1983553 RepID=A0A2H4IB60_9CAUD|nr:hypothetical protein HOS33_gp142 [Erwinia phage vB_EamM_Y3]ARW58782.1 hypothetical protein Y3_142 [Erwinia phage vB_EamM_Y3]